MKAIALLIVLIALAVGTYMNRTAEHREADSVDTVRSGLAAPVRETAPATKAPHIEVPATTEIPL
jgi:hypothetical protein